MVFTHEHEIGNAPVQRSSGHDAIVAAAVDASLWLGKPAGPACLGWAILHFRAAVSANAAFSARSLTVPAPAEPVTPAAIAVPAAAVTAPAAAVKAAAVTGDLDNIGGHGGRRGGDSYRGSTRRERWCDVLQSDSHRVTPSLALFRGPIPELRSSEAHFVTADTHPCFPTSWNLCLPVNSQRRGGRVIG